MIRENRIKVDLTCSEKGCLGKKYKASLCEKHYFKVIMSKKKYLEYKKEIAKEKKKESDKKYRARKKYKAQKKEYNRKVYLKRKEILENERKL